MKKLLKWTGMVLLTVFIILIAAGLYTSYLLPGIEVNDLTVESTPERIKRGQYLANHVTVCIDCHSSRDWSRFSGPVIPGSEGGGGEKFDHSMGFPGEFFASNITPAALSDWSDGELLRAITSGVSKNGRALFPVMPYHNYGKMTEEDAFSIIAYLRTLPAVNTVVPESRADFPMNIILNTIPEEATLLPVKSLPENEKGKYLVTLAGCVDCHTPFENGKLRTEEELSGGREFPLGEKKLISSNLTPDPETGLGNWTRERFIRRFKMYSRENYSPHEITRGDFNTIMPWVMYAEMTEEDLGAIYDYLAGLEPVSRNLRGNTTP